MPLTQRYRSTIAGQLSARKKGFLALAILGTNMATCSTVSAQSTQAIPIRDSAFSIGMGAAYAPRYEGADSYIALPLPLINYRSGRFFAGVRGVGYNLSRNAPVQFGPVVQYHAGRNDDRDDRLNGRGDINGGADVGAYMRWRVQSFSLDVTVKRGVGGDITGTQVVLGGGYTFPLSTRNQVITNASIHWADQSTLQTYFGISAAQSDRSGLTRYTADSGIREFGIMA